mgnify:CR=1 FL=1
MGKKTEVKYPNSVSETKISDQKVIREKILSIVNNNKSNNKSQYLSFFIVKLFEKNKFKSLSKEEILQTINEKYSKNPKYFKTSTDEHFKTKQSLITTLFRILNKISSYTKKNNLYKFNEKNTLKYFKKYLNTEENNIKTPVKIYNRKNNKIKKESASEDEEIKIKEENINIKEEDANDNNDVNDNKIKEEKSENDFVDMSIEIEEEKNDKNLFELFNKKLYDDFYLYLAEEGQFEQLQEKIEQFMDKYNNNELEENNKFKLLGIIVKIINVKKMIEELYKNKKQYEKATCEFEKKKMWIKYFIEVFYINIRTIKNLKNYPNLFELISGAKNLFKTDKERQNMIFDQIIKNIKEIRNIVMKSDKIKNDIIKESELIVDYFKKNNTKMEKINEFYELVKTLIKGKYSFIIREDITEVIIDKYNKCVNMCEDNLCLDNDLF